VLPIKIIIYSTSIPYDYIRGGSRASIHGKKNKKILEEALLKSLKEYMKVANPEVLKTLEELELDDEATLDHLASMYDNMHGVGLDENSPAPIKDILDFTKKKTARVGEAYQFMLERRAKDPTSAYKVLTQKYQMHHFSKLDDHQIIKHAYKKIKDSPFEIDDKTMFVKNGRGLVNLITAINNSDYEHIKLDQYGIKKKQEKKAA